MVLFSRWTMAPTATSPGKTTKTETSHSSQTFQCIPTNKPFNRRVIQPTQTPEPSSSKEHMPHLLIAAADGSYKAGSGGCAWCLYLPEDDPTKPTFTSMHRVSGSPMTAFRTEAAALLSLARFLVKTYHNPTVRIHIDCKGLISRMQTLLQEKPQLRMFKWPHIDLLWPAACLLKECNITIEHVRAHTADQLELQQEISLATWANRWCDQAANNARQLPVDDHHADSSMKIYLEHNGQTIHANEIKSLRHSKHITTFRLYLKEKYNWTTHDLNNIDWATLQKSQEQAPGRIRKYIIKQLHGWLPTTNLTNKYATTNTACPYCQQPTTNTHHIQCSKFQAQWKKCYQTIFPTPQNPRQRDAIRQVSMVLSQARQDTTHHRDKHALLLRGWWPNSLTESLHTAEISPTQVLTKWWLFTHHLWNEYCKQQNHPGIQPQWRENLKSRITLFFNGLHRLPIDQRDFVTHDEAELNTLSHNAQKQWLHIHQPRLNQRLCIQAKQAQLHTQDIRQFLRPLEPD